MILTPINCITHSLDLLFHYVSASASWTGINLPVIMDFLHHIHPRASLHFSLRGRDPTILLVLAVPKFFRTSRRILGASNFKLTSINTDYTHMCTNAEHNVCGINL